jgi:endoglucanase
MPAARSRQTLRSFAVLSISFAAACGSADPNDAAGSVTPGGEPATASAVTSTTTPAALGRGRHWKTLSATTTSTAPSPTPAEPVAAPITDPASTTTSPVAASTTSLPYRGVNLSGGEFGSALPGTEHVDYEWPTNAEVDYFMSKGMNTFRVNFQWERLQPVAQGELQPTYAAKLEALVAYATSKRATVLLNPQNFARYYGNTVGSAQVPSAVFADLWRRLALRFASNAHVMFGLVNEPHDISTEQWVGAANQAIAAIRATGARNIVSVPGNAWTGAHSWNDTWYGTSNAVGMLNVVDPGDNMVFEAHQYLDTTSGGQSDQCVSTTIGRERLQPFISWLRANGKKGLIAEFAGGNNATCNAAIVDMLNAMESASDVLTGWLWWAGGPWWGAYPFSIEPKSGLDAPQMSLLTPRLVGLPLL